MIEQLQSLKVPSGYESSMMLPEKAIIQPDTLPWLREPTEIPLSMCTMQSGESFLLASAIGTDRRLVEAAEGMTAGQSNNANNMFYSRIPQLVSKGGATSSPNIEPMESPVTNFPIFVARNRGGQRVYFARVRLGLDQEQQFGPTILRLGACDKNKQGLVMAVLSSLSSRQNHRKLSK